VARTAVAPGGPWWPLVTPVTLITEDSVTDL
jgi:hypothetical protein